MTTAEMIAETRASYAYDQDAVALRDADGEEVAIDDARVVMFLNRAVERLGTLARTRGNVTLTTAVGVSRYDLRGSALSRRAATVFSVNTTGVGSYPLSQGPEIYGSANGSPCRYQTFDREIVLSPPPASVATYTLDAYVLPKPLSIGTPDAECDLIDSLHLDACRWAAAEIARPNATEQQQRVRLADEKSLAEQEAIRLGRASVLASSRGADMPRGRYV